MDVSPCPRGCCESYREHVGSVTVAPSATPSRAGGQHAADTNAKERRWDRDMGAYKRLRQDGLQPPRIDGCKFAEATATERHHVEGGAPE